MQPKINCPSCGGDLVRVLAPGSYECARSVIAAVVPPSASGTGRVEATYRPCAFQFSGPELSSEEFCDCGLVGSSDPCFACGRRTCSRCGDMLEGLPYCGPCQAKREAEAKLAFESRWEAEEAERRRVDAGITRVEETVRKSLAIRAGEDLIGAPLVDWLRELESDLGETFSTRQKVRYESEKRNWLGMRSPVSRLENDVETWCMYVGQRTGGLYSEGTRGPEHGILVPEGMFAVAGTNPGGPIIVRETPSSIRSALHGKQADEAVRDIARAIFTRQPLGRGPA